MAFYYPIRWPSDFLVKLEWLVFSKFSPFVAIYYKKLALSHFKAVMRQNKICLSAVAPDEKFKSIETKPTSFLGVHLSSFHKALDKRVSAISPHKKCQRSEGLKADFL